MPILNIAGYKFIALHNLAELKQSLRDICASAELKGTILLSEEGINVNLAGTQGNILLFKKSFQADERFADIDFKETHSKILPFRFLKIKIKKEIITLRQPQVKVIDKRAPAIEPETLKQWLDENKDFILLDTRNAYEVELGTFKQAVHLNLKDFSELPNEIKRIDATKPIVMFCTGGIRCEKAAVLMQMNGFADVYQLAGGILNYFAKVGGDHYQGDCFVFDDRITISP